ncbi:LPS export ABC transporter permease LptG [Curvibacter sp. APW13]|uniref:LPS export ABC transporter permease LptG n=1 Tax=Curvibacter sp. APW13 TaxID=3077236 RepID=UPI0028DEC5E7|nr:LPS export ABC transporter permease LptG [Curvibacter sp. APW13]MDT8991352.1 LPS export ABC transporter permease LptG [Curvibacter sp. APW13]
MKTLRKFLYGEIVGAVILVTLAFIALFFFFDFVEELQNVGRNAKLGYQIPQALLYVGLMAPAHVYELLPITVLIGTIFVMSRFAQSSEFTILRTSGLGPWRALGALGLLGLAFTFFTFAVGDYIAPLADKTAQRLRAQFLGNLTVGKTGAWLKDRQLYGHYAVNVGALSADTQLRDVQIFEYDNQGFMVSITRAQSGTFGEGDYWQLREVARADFPALDSTRATIARTQQEELRWPTKLTADMVAAAVLKPERMGTVALFQYMHHLKSNGQSAQKYEIQFWKKVFYPLSCLVMVVLALPFAYFHFRSGSIATYVFGGVMAGISFVLLNNVLNDLGNLHGWQPWFTAALPGMIYSVLSLSAFSWLVLRR